jgi:replicative DNA helicase
VKLSAPIPTLKHQARRLKRAEGISLSAALDKVAQREGYISWSLLSAWARDRGDALFDSLEPGELLLLGARRGHGKTLRAVKLMVGAMRAGLRCWFFSLENDEPNLNALLAAAGASHAEFSRLLVHDGSDCISAAHIIERTRSHVSPRSVLVINYLQLLDQRRDSADLQQQVRELRDFARQAGCIIVFISQIQRAFDTKSRSLPGAEDVRLVNPLDLQLFDKALFLHEGKARLLTSLVEQRE